MKSVCLLLSFCLVALAQAPDPYRKARAAAEECARKQREAVEKQRASVRGQVQTAVNALQADCEPIPEKEIAPMLQDAAQREGLTPDLLRAVIQRESGFRPCAVSPKGAQGLMQLMPSTIAQFGVLKPFDPKQSLDAGAKLLKQLVARYGGDVSLALGAYNAGPNRVDSSGGIPPIQETIDYVSAILAALPAP